jgi:hypothetical protein
MPRDTQPVTEPDFERVRRLALKAEKARQRYGEDDEHREAKQTAAREAYRLKHPNHKPHAPRVRAALSASAIAAGTLAGAALLAAPVAAVATAVYLAV